MKLKTHPHHSDLLTITKEELEAIGRGEILSVSSLIVSLEKPDYVEELCLSYARGLIDHVSLGKPNLKLVFDGNTKQLKSAEVLEQPQEKYTYGTPLMDAFTKGKQ